MKNVGTKTATVSHAHYKRNRDVVVALPCELLKTFKSTTSEKIN